MVLFVCLFISFFCTEPNKNYVILLIAINSKGNGPDVQTKLQTLSGIGKSFKGNFNKTFNLFSNLFKTYLWPGQKDRPTDRPTDRFLFVSSTAVHIYDFHIFTVIYSTISKIMNSRNFFSYIWIFFLINCFSSCMDSIYNQRLHIYFRRYKAGENCGSSLFRSKRNAVVMERWASIQFCAYNLSCVPFSAQTTDILWKYNG